jgi:hypothetical protein
MEEGPVYRRTAARCLGWVASELRETQGPVPSLELDEMERDRALHQVLEVSRVPTGLHNALRPYLRGDFVVAARPLEITRSGMHGLAVLAGRTSARVLAVSASDNVDVLDLGPLGAWSELYGQVEAADPEVVTVRLTARGGQDEGVESRTWFHAVAGSPGQEPVVSVRQELETVDAADRDPCPTVLSSEVTTELVEGIRRLSIARTRRSGPGSRASEAQRAAACERYRESGEAAGSGPGAEVAAAEPCPLRTEELEPLRLVQGPDRRFTAMTVAP